MSSAIPRQVREAAVAGEELHKQAYPTVVEPADGGTPTNGAPTNGAAEPPAPAPAPAPAPYPMAADDEPDYKQKFLTLQGKYNAEMPALQSRLDGLTNVLATLNARPVQMTPMDAPQADDDERIKQVREEFGDEFVDAIVRQAVTKVEPQIRELQTAVATHNRNLEHAQQNAEYDAKQSMYAYLDQYIGDWKAINRSEEFARWLGQLDIFSGLQRQVLLENAYAANSGPRVAAFFLTFIREQTATGASPSAQPQAGYPQAQRPGLETFAAPGRGVAPTSHAGAPQGRVWTSAQIQRFYDDKRRGLFKGRQDDADRLELDIIAAAREGRVQG